MKHFRVAATLTALVGCLCAPLLPSCASQHVAPAAQAAPAAATGSAPPAKSAPPPGPVIRKLPRAQYTGNIDWYPPKAKQNHVTGRVLVGFSIDANGRPVSVKILKAEAPRALKDAATDFVRDMRFDVTDPNYNAADPTPYALSVRFCIIDCGNTMGYGGYDDVRISGSPVSPLG